MYALCCLTHLRACLTQAAVVMRVFLVSTGDSEIPEMGICINPCVVSEPGGQRASDPDKAAAWSLRV